MLWSLQILPGLWRSRPMDVPFLLPPKLLHPAMSKAGHKSTFPRDPKDQDL